MTKGATILVASNIGTATKSAIFSGATSAIRFGISSPSKIETKVTSVSVIVRPQVSAFSANIGMCVKYCATFSPIQPDTTPMVKSIRVIASWMVDRNLSGCSARLSAARARLEFTASCLSLDLRAVTTAISASENTLLSAMSPKSSARSVPKLGTADRLLAVGSMEVRKKFWVHHLEHEGIRVNSYRGWWECHRTVTIVLHPAHPAFSSD